MTNEIAQRLNAALDGRYRIERTPSVVVQAPEVVVVMNADGRDDWFSELRRLMGERAK